MKLTIYIMQLKASISITDYHRSFVGTDERSNILYVNSLILYKNKAVEIKYSITSITRHLLLMLRISKRRSKVFYILF